MYGDSIMTRDHWAAVRPLRGLRVVDMADEKAELCGRLLADFGADVIRVEPPCGGVSRSIPPFSHDTSLYYAVRNTNKRGAGLATDTDLGRQALLALLADADILIETTRPGELTAFGLDPRELSDRYPTLIVLSVTDFGQTGPYRDFVGTSAVLEAMGWMLYRAGVPELPPVLSPGALAYDMPAAGAAFAALTAYLDRLVTGRGQHIDLSIMQALTSLTDWAIPSNSVMRKVGMQLWEVREGGGRQFPLIPCADGYVRPAVLTDGAWHKLRDWLADESELISFEEWDERQIRLEAFDDLLRPIFVDYFKDKTRAQLVDEGQQRGIPITPLLSPGDVLGAEHFEALGAFVEMDPGTGVTGKVPAGFYVVDGERIGPRTPAPNPSSDADLTWGPRPAASGAVSGVPGRPFAGLRVLEFGVAGAVPEMGRLLAEYGADVVRIENHNHLDMYRQISGPSGISAGFASSNRGTRSIAVDYAQETGAQLVLDLVLEADVVVENLPLGMLERFGLGPDELLAANPGLLVVSSQLMGRRGPWSKWRGYGANTQPTSGLTYLWSFADTPEPVPANVSFPDHFVGRLGALAIAADLVGRHHGAGGARHVEISQVEVPINLLSDLMYQESVLPRTVAPQGNRSPRGAPWGVYPCEGDQRWCVITCRSDAEWQALVEAIGSPPWAEDPRLRTAVGRRAAHDEVDERLAEWTSGRSDREVMETLQEAGVPAGMMMLPDLHFDDPHDQARGFLLEVDQQGVGEMVMEGPIFHATGLPAPLLGQAPFLGEHSREIVSTILGLSPDEVERLVAADLLHDAAGAAGGTRLTDSQRSTSSAGDTAPSHEGLRPP